MSAEQLLGPLLLLLLLQGGGADAAHPPKQTGPCSWVIDTSLRPRGVLHTPNFPNRFPTPASCRWVLNSSQTPDLHTIIWFTQIYVQTGLKITEQPEEFSAQEGAGANVLLDASAHAQMLNYTWVRSAMPYLVVELRLDQLEGNHVRTRDNLLDVFGFNITYELVDHATPTSKLPERCSVLECSYAGDCLADASLTNYGCVCYNGFSGEQCQFGPLCNAELNPCLNGGVCRHMTVDAVLCTCQDSRFYGPLCELSNATAECERGGLCEAQCPFDGSPQAVCKCGLGPPVPADRARYDVTIQLLNKPNSRVSASTVAAAVNPLRGQTVEKLIKFFRSANLSVVENVSVVKIEPGVSLTFSLISSKNEVAIKQMVDALVKKGRLGILDLKAVVALEKEPALYLESVRVNQERILHEGDEFIVSCLAQGTTSMQFRWFKDGIPVNESLALRDMEQMLMDRDSRDMYTAMLRVSAANSLDEGNYTCQVLDRGVQQCKSIFIKVASPPIVSISPMSVTLSKGENLTIFCMSSNDKRSEKFGFNWTKNNALLPTNAGREMMEDLHPDGSLLRIYNAHQSATYACHVQSGAGSSSARVEVSVTAPEVIPLCQGELLMGVQWPHTAPGQVAMLPCPGQQRWDARAARRACSLYETGLARWQTPDFAQCTSPRFDTIRRKFHLLTLGYAATTPESTLRSLLIFLDSHKKLHPGEGEPVVELLSDVHDFLRAKPHSRTPGQVIATCRSACQALNMLLEHPKSLQQPLKVGQLQQLMRKLALLWGSHLGAPSSAHLDLSAVLLDIARLTTTGLFNLRYPLRPFDYPSWFTDKLDVRISAPANTSLGDHQQLVATSPSSSSTDSNLTIAVIVYRSLANFLPRRYISRLRDGDSVELQLNSHVLTVAATRGGAPNSEERNLLEVELELESQQGLGVLVDRSNWNSTCSNFGGFSWTVDACQMTFQSDNVTRCKCAGPGTYAAMLALHAPHTLMTPSVMQLPVVAGSAFCLALSGACLMLLAAQICMRKSCLVFLKLQASAAVLGAMLVFLLASTAPVPQDWYGVVTTVLESCLLVGLSAPLSTLMLVYAEVMQIRPTSGVAAIKHLRQTVVSVITGLPVVAVFSAHLTHWSTPPEPRSAFLLTAGSARFNIFVVCSSGMTVLFLVLHNGAHKRLQLLEKQNSGKNKAITRRIGLVKRASAIYMALVSVVICSLLQTNLASRACQIAFGLSCVILGVTLLVSFVVKSETPLRLKDIFLNKKKKKQKKKEQGNPEVSSESFDSPLRLFLKPDVTHGNDSGNPGVGALDVDDSATTVSGVAPPLMDEGRELLPVGRRGGGSSPRRPESQQGTVETYVQPDGSAECCSATCPDPGRCYLQPEGVIIQVCVETEPMKGYVPMGGLKGLGRGIPVAPPCVPDLTFSCPASVAAASPAKKVPSVRFALQASPPETPPAPPPAAPASPGRLRRQPDGSDGSHLRPDNVEGMLDRISHDLDYLLSRPSGGGGVALEPPRPLRSALKKPSVPVAAPRSAEAFDVGRL